MSHIVEIHTQVRDPAAVTGACRRLALAEPTFGSVQLFSGAETGLAVQLPGWRYPIVCDLASGQIKFDNFGGTWGNAARLDQFLQAYATEKAKLEAHKQGHSVYEQQLADGSIRLTIQLQGGAA